MTGVLLVDDEPLVLIGMQGMLDWAALGYEVVGTARNGAEALRAVQEKQPDIVVSDIRMPVMGLSACDCAVPCGGECVQSQGNRRLSGRTDWRVAGKRNGGCGHPCASASLCRAEQGCLSRRKRKGRGQPERAV